MKKNRFFLALLLGLFLSNCADGDSAYIDPRGTDFAGDQSCIQCHGGISHSALATAHYRATAPATPANVLGSFTPGQNTFDYGNGKKLVMERRGDSLYQVLYEDEAEIRAYPFDIVFGMQNAQTSVYWHHANTYELPVSYYRSANDWGTSPGFSSTEPYFKRKAIKDCYACHSSNVRSNANTTSSGNSNFLTQDIEDVISKKNILYGIDCERCHGPAKKHVDYHLKFPEAKTGHDITSYASLNNTQKLDACAICHSGSDGMKIKSRFDFRPGDNLTEYYRNRETSQIDVHGNQHGLLTKSKCFTKSGTMNCTTCHDAHANAAKNPEAYSAICVNCHKTTVHKKETVAMINPVQMKQNCIDCHMPEQSSQAISFKVSKDAKPSAYQLRTHRIAVYPAKQDQRIR